MTTRLCGICGREDTAWHNHCFKCGHVCSLRGHAECPPATEESLRWFAVMQAQSAAVEGGPITCLQQVKDRLEVIQGMAGDREQAHVARDRLLLDVLRAIATGQCRDYPPEDFAEEVLKAEDIGFTLWYA